MSRSLRGIFYSFLGAKIGAVAVAVAVGTKAEVQQVQYENMRDPLSATVDQLLKFSW